jgi:hypothetical protein
LSPAEAPTKHANSWHRRRAGRGRIDTESGGA